ncbi:MAG: hypothetical protein HY303_17135 [Candidatus Wallbacteria bacterium]|nr:hypothetical protein [Candidatus Wallbacteria bacterium]
MVSALSEECRRYQGQALDRYYGELDPSLSSSLDAHLGVCACCRQAEGDWMRIGGLLSSPELAETFARPPRVKAPAFARWPALAATVLGGLTMLASLAPLLTRGSHVRIDTETLALSALLWSVAYQVMYAGWLAEQQQRKLPVDVRTVLMGLLGCEAALVLSAGLILSLPLLQFRLAESVRLSVPDLLTALSGSILLAVGAVLAIRGFERPAANALTIALVHGLLLVPSRMLIHPAAALESGLSTAAFLLGCAACGVFLGTIGALAERARLPGQDWHAEPA